MITFILGEDRHVKYFVHSVDQYDYFAIKEANFSLLHNGKEEAAGVCTIERDEEKMVIMSTQKYNQCKKAGCIP